MPVQALVVPSPRQTEHLTCAISSLRDGVAVVVRGELDLATVGVVDATLRDLRSDGCPRLVLDLEHVEFADAQALHLLCRWADLALLEGFALRVVPGPRVASLLELARMTGRLAPALATR